MTETRTKVRTMRRAHGYVMYAFVGGRTRQRSCGTKDRRVAHRKAKQWEREINEGRWTPQAGSAGSATLRGYADDWIARRRARGIRSVDGERRHLDHHVLPHLGSRLVSELSGAEVVDWIWTLRGEGTLAPKTIRNVHSTLRAMLADAKFRRVVEVNVAADLPRGTLPDGDSAGQGRSRAPSTYSREDVETLLVDERIPEDRRALYAMVLLAGLRCGEAVGRRWRDLDTDAEPLQRLTVESQYDDRPLKTGKPRLVPVHPVLAEVLDEWRREGFARIFGRHPEPGDWIVPSRGRGKAGSGVRAGATVYHHLQADCGRVGVEPRRLHDTRHTFTTLARVDGADSFWLERVTHNSKGSMLDHYTGTHWESLCEAVGTLRVQLRRPAEVVALRPTGTAGGDDGGEDGAIAASIAAFPVDAQTPTIKACASGDMGGEASCSASGSFRSPSHSAEVSAAEGSGRKAAFPGDSGQSDTGIAPAIAPELAARLLDVLRVV